MRSRSRRKAAPTAEGSDFGAADEEGFEEGLAGFFGDGGDVHLLEAGFLEEDVEGVFFKAEPDVGVELAGFFEGVLF